MAVLFDNITSDEPAFGERLDFVISLKNIPLEARNRLNQQKVMWIDIEKKERSDLSNDLGEEVALYLKRYGVRLFRVST